MKTFDKTETHRREGKRKSLHEIKFQNKNEKKKRRNKRNI